MKLWLDDARPMPNEYDYHAHSVEAAKMMIKSAEDLGEPIEMIDCDHDLGEFANYGGDGIKLLDWLVERGTFYPIKLHTQNPVGRANMQRIIDRYWHNAEPSKLLEALQEALDSVTLDEVVNNGTVVHFMKSDILGKENDEDIWNEATLFKYNDKKYVIVFKCFGRSNKKECITFKEIWR